MARKQRKCHENAWLHVMSKGTNHQNIFINDGLHYYFLSLLKMAVKKFEIEIHAYCLMNNHYHLLIRTPKANISDAMQYINGNYGETFNIKTGKKGPVFISRFRSIIVSSKKYLLILARYIHRNPVKAGLIEEPRSYAWSSCQFYFSSQKCPEWLTIGDISEIHTELIPSISLQEFTNENIILNLDEIETKIRKENQDIEEFEKLPPLEKIIQLKLLNTL